MPDNAERLPAAGLLYVCSVYRKAASGGFSVSHSVRFVLALADSACRTYACTCSAANAGICINLVLAVALGNCIDRALAGTGTAANTGIVNYICHDNYLLYFYIDYIL